MSNNFLGTRNRDDHQDRAIQTLQGYKTAFEAVYERPPTEQECWNAAITAGRETNRAPIISNEGLAVLLALGELKRNETTEGYSVLTGETMLFERMDNFCMFVTRLDGQQLPKTGTFAANWREQGDPDPHGESYNCERAALSMGHLTDDELANEAYMNYDRNPDIATMMSGKAFRPIVWMTAVKDRIRWLSRALVSATAELVATKAKIKDTWDQGYQTGYNHGAADNCTTTKE